MSEKMSKEVLNALVKAWDFETVSAYGFDPNVALDDLRALLAEVHRLLDRERMLIEEKKELHEALRSEYITVGKYYSQCRCQKIYWDNKVQFERHAPGCLAAPMKEEDQ